MKKQTAPAASTLDKMPKDYDPSTSWELTIRGRMTGMMVNSKARAIQMLEDARAMNRHLPPSVFGVNVFARDEKLGDWVDGPAFLEA